MSTHEGYIEWEDGTVVPADQLRVFRVLSTGLDPLISDFTIMGFKKVSPKYDRGRKAKAEYKCPTKDEMIVEKIFRDIRDASGRLIGLEITFNWYTEDNQIGLTKTEIVKNYNIYESETVERYRRERQIDFLTGSARGTAFESYIGILFAHYHDQIEKYVQEWDSNSWNDAMDNETNQTILGILHSYFPTASNPYKSNKIIESIKYQIGTLDSATIDSLRIDTPQELLTALGL